MKKLQNRWRKACNRVLGSLLLLLGFTGCTDYQDDDDGGGYELMYGVMPAQYEIKGKVVNADTRQAVPGIRVLSGTLYSYDDKEPFTYHLDTLYTDAKGEFKTYYRKTSTNKHRLIWEDVDGEANGSYQKDSVDVNVKSKEAFDVTLKIKKKTSK